MEEFDEIITGSFELSFERSVIKVIDKLRINIIIESMDGRNIVIGTRSPETILELKKKIRGWIRFDEEEHRLDYRGTLLIGDRRRIGDCGISEGSIIKVAKVTKFNITVFAKISYNDNVELTVTNTDKIIDIKKKIEEKIGLSPDEQKLVYQGELLEDDYTIDYYKFAEKSVIDVVNRLREIRIFAKRMYGKTVAFEISKNDRIIDIKKKILENMGLSPDEQQLVYQGEILEDDKTVDHYQITEKSVIDVVNRLRRMQIFAKTLDGKTVALEVSNFDRIFDIKKKIEEKIGLSPDEQLLYHNGQQLYRDDKTVDYYKIVEKSVIDVITRTICNLRIFVTTMNNGRTIISEGTNFDQIIDIKKKIQEKIGVSPDEQIMKVNGHIVRDDNARLYNYDNTNNYTIDVSRALKCDLRIFVSTMDGRKNILEVTNLDKIIDIKKKIEEKIGVSPVEQKLVYQGQQLDDDNRNVDYYNITDGTVIHVVVRLRGGMKIFAKTMDGMTVAFEVMTNERIIDIKKKIREKIGVSPDEQQLVYQGGILYDDKTVDHYNITDKFYINVVVRLRDIQIFAKTMDGETIAFEGTNFDRIIDIKKKIEEKIGLSPDKQIIKVNGTFVRDDNARMYYYDITNNYAIDVFRVLKINITLLTHNMETVQIQVLNNDRIIDVKKKIEEKIGLPSYDQRLEYLEESLDDYKLLCEYNIRGNSDVTILKPVKQKTRGICLVISNEHFTNNSDPRTGTKLDEERIRSIFKTMGYKVEIHRNVRNSDMDSVIEDTKKLVKRSHKILIVFILSHGEEKGVYTSDGAIIPLKNICTPFTNTKFSLFVGKPKIFFFVCCQGSNENPGVNVAGGSMTVYDCPTTVTRVPAMADLFIGYATCPSYVSCRTATEGTFYVSKLCDVIEEHPLWSVVDIHQEVQSIISRIFINDGRYFQMPYCENILREHAYFVDQ